MSRWCIDSAPKTSAGRSARCSSSSSHSTRRKRWSGCRRACRCQSTARAISATLGAGGGRAGHAVCDSSGSQFRLRRVECQGVADGAEDRGSGRRDWICSPACRARTVFTSIGTGDNAFTRIAREMTAYYLLSAEPEPKDRDGRTHKIKVTLSRPGVTVRARATSPWRVNKAARHASPARQAVANVLGAPLLATELR